MSWENLLCNIENYDDLVQSIEVIESNNNYPADEWLANNVIDYTQDRYSSQCEDFKTAALKIAEVAYNFGQEDAEKDFTKCIVLDPCGEELRIGGKVQFDTSYLTGWKEYHEPQIYTISGFDFRNGECIYVNVEVDNGTEAINWNYCKAYVDSWKKYEEDLRNDLDRYSETEDWYEIARKYRDRARLLGQYCE